MAQLGTHPISAPGWPEKTSEDVALIDCDVHHNVRSPKDLFPFLSRAHQEILTDQGLLLPSSGFFNVPWRMNRPDLSEGRDDGIQMRERCDNYAFLRERHLDVWQVDYALLTGPPPFYSVCVLPDVDYAAALCRAFNDFTLEQWLPHDERLLAAIMVSPSDPIQAVQEVKRLADHPQVVGITIPNGARFPYGNRFYHPLWEACEQSNLGVIVHAGAAGAGIAPPISAVGMPTYYMEERMARPAQATAHCASMICEGVFEKYPNLKVAFIEVQQYWAIGLMWHMDADWKALRDQTPWLKMLPSEYFRRNVRVGSQPMHEPETPDQLLGMLDSMHADETLIYCSDFPHYDWDDPTTNFPPLEPNLHQRIFSKNAAEMFGL